MKNILLVTILSWLFTNAYPQANGSFYSLQLGKKTCLFKYEEKPDSTYVETDSAHSNNIITQINPVTLQEKIKFIKDTVILRGHLTLQDNTIKFINSKKFVSNDTLTAINPVTLEEHTTVSHKPIDSVSYHLETTMSYFDFLLLLKSKFELKNPQKNLRVYSYNIFYETQDTSGYIKVEYPETAEGVISKLNCLTKGGIVLLNLQAADHNLIKINKRGFFLALIHIKN